MLLIASRSRKIVSPTTKSTNTRRTTTSCLLRFRSRDGMVRDPPMTDWPERR